MVAGYFYYHYNYIFYFADDYLQFYYTPLPFVWYVWSYVVLFLPYNP